MKSYFIDMAKIQNKYFLIATNDRGDILEKTDNFSCLKGLHKTMKNKGYQDSKIKKEKELRVDILNKFFKNYLTLDIEVKLFSNLKRSYGYYKFLVDDSPLHMIQLQEWLPVNLANFVLHHELQHAIQTESLFNKSMNSDKMYQAYLEELYKNKQENYNSRVAEISATNIALSLCEDYNFFS